MKPLLFSAAILLATGPALADTCKATADARKLHGAALTSFMKKCERDSKTACDSQATEKKRRGAHELHNEVRERRGGPVTVTRSRWCARLVGVSFVTAARNRGC